MEARRRDGGADPRSASCRAQKTYNWLQMRMSSSVTLYGRNRTGVAMLPNDCRRQSVGNAALRRLLTSPSVCQFFVTSFSLRSIDVAREVPSAIAIAATVSTGKKTQWKRRGRVKKKAEPTKNPNTKHESMKRRVIPRRVFGGHQPVRFRGLAVVDQPGGWPKPLRPARGSRCCDRTGSGRRRRRRRCRRRATRPT